MTGPGFCTKARAGFCSLRLAVRRFANRADVCAAGCKNSPGSGLAARGGGGENYFVRSRYRKETTCARVQVASGLKVVALVPAVTPLATAQRTAGS